MTGNLIESAFYIKALEITDEEKFENEKKFAEWYANFKEQHKNLYEERENGIKGERIG